MKKYLVFGIIILFIGSSIIPSIVGEEGINYQSFNEKPKVTSGEITSIKSETDFLALLIAVGVYEDHPDEDRPTMLTDVEMLREKLLISPHWNEENINVIKAENATVLNIIKGLRWLDRKDRKDDFSLVYITTHGYPLSFDIPPRDEDDKQDEALISYKGFKHPWLIIWDDLLNLFLSLLDAQGVCVIIDSCFAGGFNDPPYFNSYLNENRMTADEWMHGFGEDLNDSGRVVLMSCSEDELSYASVFTPILIEGLTGYADVNEDDMVSAEEAFDYAIDYCGEFEMHPTIFDGYPGELQLTEVEFPPTPPETPMGPFVGETNTTYYYTTVSIDPAGDNISYGWDWDGDFVVDEWTDFLASNTTVNVSYLWSVEGTHNLRVIAKDERGLLSKWSNEIVVIMCDNNFPDQQQKKIEHCAHLFNQWVAQSFVPSWDILSKVEIVLASWPSGSKNPPPLNLYIRDDLAGENLAESSKVISEMKYGTYAWFTFDFKDIDVTPGETYYIVCEPKDWPYFWYWYFDCYPLGKGFRSNDGVHWTPLGDPQVDCCFVTWAKQPEYPYVFDPLPIDGNQWIPTDISQLRFNLKDYQGNSMNYTVETVPDIGTGEGNNVGNGSYSINVSGLEYSTDYLWFVNVTDGEHWNEKVFTFRTQPKMVFDPFDEGWQYRKEITINHERVTGNLTEFPVLISIDDDDLKNKAQTDGDDILFMDGDDVAKRLFHEFERYNGSSGELVAWVNVTNISSSVDTVFYMYYGNSDCDSQEYPDHVWDLNYCGVWHLNDFLDSTSNGNDGINYGTDNCSGKIDIAKDFVETNEDYVSLGDMPEPANSIITEGTFEVWINPDEVLGRSIICKLDTKLEPDRKSYYMGLMNTGQLQFSAHSGTWYSDGRNIRGITDLGHITSDNWQQVVVLVNLSIEDIVIYYNGEEIDVNITTKGTPPAYFYNINLDERLGKYSPESSGPSFFNGSMDEIRISKICRSADWIQTQYNNQNEPSSFYNVGPEESGP
jgi:hypothetical protein